MTTTDVEDQFAELLSDERWRLWNLYKIKPPRGGARHFIPNAMQERFYASMWYRNTILKARQLGFSTFIEIFILDRMIFGGDENGNVGDQKAGIIDVTREDAAEKLNKIKFAYKNIGLTFPGEEGEALNRYIHAMCPAVKSNESVMEFGNGSSVHCGTSFTGSTLQYLHVSEFGKICDEPGGDSKAQEIKTGALPATEEGMIFFESTHRGGRQGKNYEMLKEAQENTDPSPKQFKFHFYPWHWMQSYRDSNKPRPTPEEAKYFEGLKADHGIELDDGQKAFWIRQHREHKEQVKKEYPSTPEDAFDAPIDGAIYGDRIAYLRGKGRICEFECEDRYPVWCSWDIGRSDYTSIWAVQVVGPQFRWLDWYESNGENVSHYVQIMKEWSRKYPIAAHFLPHDAGRKNEVGKSWRDYLIEGGLHGVQEPLPITSDRWLGINELREIFKNSWFHQRVTVRRIVNGQESDSGLDHLERYKKRVNKAGSVISEDPVHNEASHTADAARYFAEAWMLGRIDSEMPAGSSMRKRRPGGQSLRAGGARR